MAPATPILDTFNRADSTTTLGSNWSLLKNFLGAFSDEGILSNQAYNPHAQFAAYIAMYWNPSTFGPDSEVYLTFTTKPTANSNDNPSLILRANNPGANFTGYELTYTDSGTIKINR